MNAQVPAYLQNRQKPVIANTIGSSFGVQLPPHVSLLGSRFTLVDGSGNRLPLKTMYLDCVILDVNQNSSKMYWGGRDYDPADTTPPVCFSDNGIGASERATQPQHTSCALCPHSKWGSAVSRMTGKGIPACQDGIKFAVIAIGVPGVPPNMVFSLRTPPKSIKQAKEYSNTIKANNVDLCDVVTRLTFVEGVVGELHFMPRPYEDGGAWIDAATAQLEQQLWTKTQEMDRVLGRDDVPYEGPIPDHGADFPTPAAIPGEPTLATAVPAPPAEKRGRGRPPTKKDTLPPSGSAPVPPAPVPPAPVPPAPASTAFGAGDPGAGNPGAGFDPIPGFLQRPAVTTPPATGPSGGAASFGMQANAPVPHADLSRQLDEAMALGTRQPPPF